MEITRRDLIKISATMTVLTLFACACLSAQQNLSSNPQNSNQSGNATESLQKATQNPVPNLISVPLQATQTSALDPLTGIKMFSTSNRSFQFT
jgi:hypothetical protein